MLNQPQVMAQATPPALSTSTGTVELPLQVDAKKKTLQDKPLGCFSRWEPSPTRTLRSS